MDNSPFPEYGHEASFKFYKLVFKISLTFCVLCLIIAGIGHYYHNNDVCIGFGLVGVLIPSFSSVLLFNSWWVLRDEKNDVERKRKGMNDR